MSFLLNVWYQQQQKKKKKKRNEKKTERKKKRKDLIPFISKVYVLINSFIFFFMIHEATRAIRCKMKSKLYLPIILLINYITEENLFFNVE